MVEHAKPVVSDHHDRERKLARPVAYFIAGRQRYAPAPDALDRHVGKTAARRHDGTIEFGEIDFAFFRACGDERRRRFQQMNGIDLIEREDIPCSFAEKDGIHAIPTGDGLERRRLVSLLPPGTGEPTGEPSLADAGIGAGDEIAGHGIVS